MNIKELVFTNKQDMIRKMEPCACEYEGYVSGRHGYNFPNKDGSYTIAYIKGDHLTKQHEMCHAKYFFDINYRIEIEKLWSSLTISERNIVEKFLNKCGYKKEVWLDEFQAYVTSEKDPEKFFGLKRGTLKKFLDI